MKRGRRSNKEFVVRYLRNGVLRNRLLCENVSVRMFGFLIKEIYLVDRFFIFVGFFL